MLKNYLSITLRNIRQNPLYAFINIFSLSIGLAACIVIYLFIKDERSFDSFHSKADNIYRLDEVQNFTGTNLQKVALSMPGMGPHLKQDFPEVKEYTRFWNHSNRLVKKDDQQIIIEDFRAVDSTFLDIFDFKLIYGDRATVLDEPNSVVLTSETAAKFFPSLESVVGNTITIIDQEFKITGILEDIPENSHMQLDGLISINTFTRKDPGFNDRWGGNFLNTYLVLEPGTDIAKLESKMPDFMLRFTGDKDINKYYTLFFQKLDQVHLASMDIEHDYNNYRKFNGQYLDVFFLVGVFILLIASVNFMNLTTARASHRWKEIGVRKTIGAKRIQLFGQFIFESSFMSAIALMLALVLTVLFVPILNQLIGRELTMISLLNHPIDIVLIVLLALTLGLLTGIYPSLYMTSFDLSRIFKGGNSKNKSVFRSALVVVQFGLALAMIVSTSGDVEQVILTVDFKQLRPFGRQSTARARWGAGILDKDLLSRAGFYARGIGIEFDQFDLTRSIDQVRSSIIVEKQAVVVVGRLKRMRFPRPFFDVFCGVNMRFAGRLGKGGCVVNTVVVTQAAGPGTAPVGAFAVSQVQRIDAGQGIVRVANQLPVDQVFRLHNGQPRTQVHGRAAHVIGAAHPNHGHIRHIREDDRVVGHLRHNGPVPEQQQAG